jgi:hypothetical protein
MLTHRAHIFADPRVRKILFVPAVAMLALLLFSNNSSAQTMSFSVYADYSASQYGEENFKVWGFTSAEDHSTGCTHSNYSLETRLYSPSNRQSSSTQPGMSSSTNLAFNNDEGNYTIVGFGSYQCACAPGSSPHYGSSFPYFSAAIAQTHYKNCIPAPNNGCYCNQLDCTAGTAPTCGIGTPTFSVRVGDCWNRMVARWLRLVDLYDGDWICVPPGIAIKSNNQGGPGACN